MNFGPDDLDWFENSYLTGLVAYFNVEMWIEWLNIKLDWFYEVRQPLCTVEVTENTC